MSRCEFAWCDYHRHEAVPGEATDYHVCEIGFGLALIVDGGEVRVNWMPDWSEWVVAPDAVDREFGGVLAALQNLPAALAEFTQEVTVG